MSCDSLDPYFLINGVGSVVTLGLLCYFTPRKCVVGVENLGMVLANLAVWCFLPPTIFFLIFHEAVPDMYESSREMACAAVRNLTLQGFVLLATLMFLFVSILGWWISRTEAVDPCYFDEYFYESPQHPVKDGEKLIVLGLTDRGGRFIRMLQRLAGFALEKVTSNIQCAENQELRDKQPLVEENACGMPHSDVQAHLVDYTGESKHAVIVKALATGVVKSADELHVICPEPSAKCLFTLPYDDNSIDRVVLTPFFRGSAPAAPNKFVKTDYVERRMSLLLAEALRVLRKGGTIVYVDALFDVLMVQADLRDLGFATTIEDLHMVVFDSPSWRLCGTKENDPVAPDEHAVDVKHTENALSQPLYSETYLLGLAWVQQTIVFAIFCWLTAVVYPHTSVPRNIGPSERLNNCFVECTLLYPAFAFISRSMLVANRESVRSARHLVLTIANMEVRVVLATFAIGSVGVFAPRFAVQNAFCGNSQPAAELTVVLGALSLQMFIGALLYLAILFISLLAKRKECKRRKVQSEYIEKLLMQWISNMR